jgi:NhaP-type Na+/H+ or K+/H+ antiporter
MSSDDPDRREVCERVASAEAELDRHQRVTRMTLLVLTVLSALGLGLFLVYFAGMPLSASTR